MSRPSTFEVMQTTFHYDAEHEWLEVSNAQMMRVDVLLNQFGTDSYVDSRSDGSVYYLEWDGDSEWFIMTARDQGIKVVWTEKDDGERSFIQSLKPIEIKPITLAI
jgi:hypothetical protein